MRTLLIKSDCCNYDEAKEKSAIKLRVVQKVARRVVQVEVEASDRELYTHTRWCSSELVPSFTVHWRRMSHPSWRRRLRGIHLKEKKHCARADVCCNSSECFTTSSWEATPARALSREFNFVIIKLNSAARQKLEKSKEKTRHWWCATLNMVKSASLFSTVFISGVLHVLMANVACACSSSCRKDERGARRGSISKVNWQLNLPGSSFAFLTPLLFKMQISCLKWCYE